MSYEPTQRLIGELIGYANVYLTLYQRQIRESQNADDHIVMGVLQEMMHSIEFDGFRRLAFNCTGEFFFDDTRFAEDKIAHDNVNWVGFAKLVIALVEARGVDLDK